MSATIIPTMRYADAPAAIEFLQRAFGFDAPLVVQEGDVVFHAQLTLRTGMVMLGSAQDEPDGFGALVRTQAPGTKPIASAYVIVDDVAAHAAAAAAQGAEILMEPEAQEYGGSVYTCRDPQGGVWSFGDYDPWAEEG